MGNILIGVDTSKDKGKHSSGKWLIGTVIGKPADINKFVNMLSSTAQNNNYSGILHWKRIRTSIRKQLLKEHINTLKELNLNAIIFDAKREGIRKRPYFLKKCPWSIGSSLHSIITENTDKVEIISDCDFDTLAPFAKADAKSPTIHFLEKLITKIASEIASVFVCPVTEKGEVRINVKRHNLKPVLVKGHVGSKLDFAIIAADLLLGMYQLARSQNQAIDHIIVKKIR
jgi:hypothetical protein